MPKMLDWCLWTAGTVLLTGLVLLLLAWLLPLTEALYLWRYAPDTENH
jgi:hypothetical protein